MPSKYPYLSGLLSQGDRLEIDVIRNDVIRRRGRKWLVFAEDGKLLGAHDTEADAKKQLQAIEALKARKSDG